MNEHESFSGSFVTPITGGISVLVKLQFRIDNLTSAIINLTEFDHVTWTVIVFESSGTVRSAMVVEEIAA